MTSDAPREPLDAQLLRDLLRAPVGVLARVEVRSEVTSTNTVLVAEAREAPHAWPIPSLLVADHQTAGRGRLDRAWQTPPHTALTASLLVAPSTPRATWGWLPLLAGLAAARALRSMTGLDVRTKWPNDVLVPAPDGDDLLGWGPWRKVGGILAEVVDDERVVVGLGINVDQGAEELPVASASSLAAHGASQRRELLVAALENSFVEILALWREHAGDAVAAGLADEVAALCVSVGTDVRVTVAGGREVRGTSTGLGADGALLVRVTSGEVERIVSGDVQHLRVIGVE
ncbi:biotin--[acetyl-CoA-carboxylase] ligase [Sanguibacter sp. A247]|uniref:biotin--[acetyl-CoA-carboxylase] ligase n=1 Tax=unclassified Sanguibacter TaxID=2645534 RepID=UPI003FD8A722